MEYEEKRETVKMVEEREIWRCVSRALEEENSDPGLGIVGAPERPVIRR